MKNPLVHIKPIIWKTYLYLIKILSFLFTWMIFYPSFFSFYLLPILLKLSVHRIQYVFNALNFSLFLHFLIVIFVIFLPSISITWLLLIIFFFLSKVTLPKGRCNFQLLVLGVVSSKFHKATKYVHQTSLTYTWIYNFVRTNILGYTSQILL